MNDDYSEKTSTRVLLDLRKEYDARGDFRVQLSDGIPSVMSIEIESITMSGVATDGMGSGIPYVPYFIFELIDSTSHETFAVARTDPATRTNTTSANGFGIPLMLSNAPYDKIEHETPGTREIFSMSRGVGQLKNFRIRVSAPPSDADVLSITPAAAAVEEAPLFTRMTILMRAYHGRPQRRIMRAEEVTSEMLAAAQDFGNIRGSAFRT